jgi:hypothetical protein
MRAGNFSKALVGMYQIAQTRISNECKIRFRKRDCQHCAVSTQNRTQLFVTLYPMFAKMLIRLNTRWRRNAERHDGSRRIFFPPLLENTLNRIWGQTRLNRNLVPPYFLRAFNKEKSFIVICFYVFEIGVLEFRTFSRIIIKCVSSKLSSQQDRPVWLLSYISGQTTQAKQNVQRMFLACCKQFLSLPSAVISNAAEHFLYIFLLGLLASVTGGS